MTLKLKNKLPEINNSEPRRKNIDKVLAKKNLFPKKSEDYYCSVPMKLLKEVIGVEKRGHTPEQVKAFLEKNNIR